MASGLKKISTDRVQVYKVIDSALFARACRKWVSSMLWDNDFYERNDEESGDFDPPGLKMLNSEEVKSLIGVKGSAVEKTDFGNLAQVIGITKKQFPSGSQAFNIYFKATNNIPKGCYLFVHLLNTCHEIQFQHDFIINPTGKEIAKGTIWRSVIKVPKSEISASEQLAFGVYNTSTGALMVSNGKHTDWGGRRLIMQLNK